jgi:ATP synthase F1 delta subunit
MIPRELAKRYATALLQAALKADVASRVSEEVRGLRKMFEKDPAFKNFLLSPQVLTEEKKRALDAVFKGRLSDLLLNFLNLLIDKKRFLFVEEIAAAFIQLYEKHEGILKVKVVTAVPLEEAARSKLIDKLESETKKKIRLSPTTDPEIIGGMVLIMEDKIIDGSVRHHMEKLKRDLDEISMTSL